MPTRGPRRISTASNSDGAVAHRLRSRPAKRFLLGVQSAGRLHSKPPQGATPGLSPKYDIVTPHQQYLATTTIRGSHHEHFLVVTGCFNSGVCSARIGRPFTDEDGCFVSESTVYRLLEARALITSPAFILIQGAERFSKPTTALNSLWRREFRYLQVVACGGFYLSAVLDSCSRYIPASGR